MPTGPKGQEGCSATTYQLIKKLIKIGAEVSAMGVISPSRCGGRYPEATLPRHPAADRGTPAIALSITGVTGPVLMRFSKTRGELCLEESEIDILGQQRADITTLADHQRHFAGSGLATGASLRKPQSQQTGNPVDA